MVELSKCSLKYLAFIYLILLSICPYSTSYAQSDEDETGEPPVELPEVKVTGKPIEETYIVEDATTATKTDTPIKDIPQSIQV